MDPHLNGIVRFVTILVSILVTAPWWFYLIPGKTVVDLFAGIGYFTLAYLKHAGAEHVYACEWNPAAVQALTKNLVLNNIEPTRCTILEVLSYWRNFSSRFLVRSSS